MTDLSWLARQLNIKIRTAPVPCVAVGPEGICLPLAADRRALADGLALALLTRDATTADVRRLADCLLKY